MGKSLFVNAPVTSATTAATTQYVPLTGGIPLGSYGTVEADRQIVYRDTGTFSKLLVRLTLNSTNASTTIRTRKNAATNGNLTVSPPAGTSGVYEDTANSDAVTAGDKWVYQIVHTGTGTISISLFSVIFDATTNTVSRLTVGSAGNFTTASATRYMSLSGSLSFGSTEATAQMNIRYACTGKHLTTTISANARTTATTVRTRKNTANGNMSLSIGAGVTGTVEEASPGTNSDTLAVDDLYCYQFVTSTGTQNISFVTFSVSLISTTGSAMHALAGIGGIGTVVNQTAYIWWSGANPASTTETHYMLKLREAFTFSQLYVKLSANTTGASTIRLRKNGADGNLATSIAASTSGNFSDTTNSDACIATDEVTLQHTWGAGGAVTQIYMSVVSSLPTSVSTTTTHKYHVDALPAKSIIQSVAATPVSANDTRYFTLFGDLNGNTTETNKKHNLRPNGILSNVRLYVSSNSVTATSTFRLRKNGANGNQVLSITSSATGMFTDASNTDSITAGDDVNYQLIAGATGSTITPGMASILFDADDPTLTVTKYGLNGISSISTASNTTYSSFQGASISATTENDVQILFKKSGTLRYLDVRILTNARTTTTTIRTRKNTANGAQSVSIGGTCYR